MGTTETKKMRVGVVGCGAISDIYQNDYHFNRRVCQNFLVGTALDAILLCFLFRMFKMACAACCYLKILADPSIEMVVILTPAPTHEGLIRQALEAGKHVYTEKTMTLADQSVVDRFSCGLQCRSKEGVRCGTEIEMFLLCQLDQFRCRFRCEGHCESFWSGGSRCIVRAKPCGEACEHHSGQPGIRTGI